MLSEKTNSPWLLLGGLLVVGLMTIAAYFRARDESADPGTTTALLYFKTELRGISQNLSRRDLVSILQFAALTFIILPVLPDRNYGPHNALNPYQIWLMVVLIAAGASLAGYVALRLVGQRYGAVLLGLLGGLVSSTATTLAYARHSKDSEGLAQLAVVVILLANLTVLIRLAVVSAVVSPSILPQLLPVLGCGLALGLAAVAYWWRKLSKQSEVLMPEISNPTEICTALGFGLLYAAVLFFAAWLSDIAGSGGHYAVALVSGLTDVDAITLSSLRLFELGKLQGA